MKQDDARKLNHTTLEEMRMRAVRSVQAGESPEVVARSMRINRRTIYGWLAQYRRGGWGALKAKPLFGRPPKLDARASANSNSYLRLTTLMVTDSLLKS
jgi:transposase